jgi:hypothetical protein
MDQNNQNPAPATDPQATAPQANSDSTALFSTKAEAEAAKPAKAPKGMRPFECSKGGVVLGWINARGYDHALSMLAKREGFTVSTGTPKAAITVEAAAAKLASLDDATLAVLGLSRTPAPTVNSTPAARKTAAKK